jgi:hypothetical protein
MLPVEHPLYGSFLKAKWASQHIMELNGVLTAYGELSPYTIFEEVCPEKTDSVWMDVKLRLTKPLPLHGIMLSSYALFDLRSALDCLATALAAQNKFTKISDVYFPILRSKERYEDPSTRGKVSKHFSPDAVAFIDAQKPYQGGNDILWALHALNIMDKHQVIVDVGLNAAMGSFEDNSTGYFEIPGSIGWQSLKKDRILYRYPVDAKPNPKMQIAIGIAFTQVSVVEHKPVMIVLGSIAEMVKGILEAAKDRFFA